MFVPVNRISYEAPKSVITVASSTPPYTLENARSALKAVNPVLVLVRIAECESGFRQFYGNGSVIRGIENPKDVGLFQISETYWLKEAERLGYNIYEIEGNANMAIHIFRTQGLSAWLWSNPCHHALD